MKKLSFMIIFVILFFSCESLKGPAGPQGEKGEQGEQGPQGEKGESVYTEVSVDETSGNLLISNVIWYLEESPSTVLIVKGLAKNVGSTNLEYVTIYSKSYDFSGNLISLSDMYNIDKYALAPGEESSWKLTDHDCVKEPFKVTIGYTFFTSVVIPAPKK